MLPGKKYGISDYLALARRYWWIVVLTTSMGAFAALIVSATEKDTYQSDMLIQIIPQTVPENILPSTVTIRTEERMGSLEAQVKSRSQLERLIREFNLYPELQGKVPMEDIVEVMRGAIKVDLIRQPRRFEMAADSFYVRFKYGDPAMAAKVVAALGSLFVSQNAEERIKLAGNTSQILTEQVNEAKRNLEQQEAKIERFRQQYAGRLPTQADSNMQMIQTTNTQVQSLVESIARDQNTLTMEERLYNLALNEPAPVPVQPVAPVGASDPNGAPTASLQTQLAAAKAALTRLEGRLTSEHPDLRRQRRVVADLEQRVAALPPPEATPSSSAPAVTAEEQQRRERLRIQKANIDALKGQIAFKESEERRLRAVIADYQGRLAAIPGLQSEWTKLTRDYDTLRALYDDLLRKSKGSEASVDLERRQVGESFKIVDAATVPVKPIGPIRLQINGIGTGAGLALGVGIVALLFLRDRTFHSEGDVLQVLALPVLALVPYVADEAQINRRRHRRLVIAGALAVAVVSCSYVTWTMELWRYVA